MFDPLRERDPYGGRKARLRRIDRPVLRRTNQAGIVPSDALQSSHVTQPAAVVVQFQSQTRLPTMGHNGGPLLAPDDPNESWRHYC
jgi:hypothetical protein